MKRILLILILFITSIIATGCSSAGSASVIPPKNMSPEETVKFYFEQWSNKNQQGMDSVVYEKLQSKEGNDLGHLKYVKLLSCEQVKDDSKISFEDAWYPNPFEIAKVDVTYDIKYNSGNDLAVFNGESKYEFYLVKESADSDWIIVMLGVN